MKKLWCIAWTVAIAMTVCACGTVDPLVHNGTSLSEGNETILQTEESTSHGDATTEAGTSTAGSAADEERTEAPPTAPTSSTEIPALPSVGPSISLDLSNHHYNYDHYDHHHHDHYDHQIDRRSAARRSDATVAGGGGSDV